MTDRPVGPPVDTTPRPLPARIPITGRYAVLEPLHRRHAPELWRAAQAAARDDELGLSGLRPVRLGRRHGGLRRPTSPPRTTRWPGRSARWPPAWSTGWLTLMDIQPKNAAIELGHIWFGPPMQRTRAATEAMFLLLRLAADDLGYRRLVWKCNALNAPVAPRRRPAGLHLRGHAPRPHGGQGPAAGHRLFQHPADEWPRCRDALLAWLDPANFAPDGTARRGLAEIRAQFAGVNPSLPTLTRGAVMVPSSACWAKINTFAPGLSMVGLPGSLA